MVKMLSQDRLTESYECERAWVEIDLDALADNAAQIRARLSPQTELMAVIKADAYGHGAVTIARKVLQQGVAWLGVATIPEGVELRRAGIEAPILILGAVNTDAQAQAIARWQLQPTLSTPKQALICARNLDQPLPVHLMIDTGMSRLGYAWEQALEFIQFVQGLPNLRLAGLYSHLSMADAPDPASMLLQQQRFEQVVKQMKEAGIELPHLHLANSAATLRDPSFHYDLVRVGLALYGLYPAPHLQSVLPLKPVLQVRARVTLVKAIAAGTGVSYGHQFVADKPMRIAVLGIGYADGVPRRLSNQMTVLIRGQRVPQIGTITMDQLMVDISQIPDLQEGEVATLLGEDGGDRITAEDWAQTLGTISWEILCGFKHRLPRVAE
jgi:alanine racemase